jgi:hypothetical protein
VGIERKRDVPEAFATYSTLAVDGPNRKTVRNREAADQIAGARADQQRAREGNVRLRGRRLERSRRVGDHGDEADGLLFVAVAEEAESERIVAARAAGRKSRRDANESEEEPGASHAGTSVPEQ